MNDQPINDHNDGSGYWYQLWTIRSGPDGPWQHGFDIMADDDTVIRECEFTYPTSDQAIDAAKRVITIYRSAR